MVQSVLLQYSVQYDARPGMLCMHKWWCMLIPPPGNVWTIPCQGPANLTRSNCLENIEMCSTQWYCDSKFLKRNTTISYRENSVIESSHMGFIKGHME